ncbi:hypothetical protein SAMN05421820_10361 [Pedobacter steynii]|uniref:Uncharacterized protein n=1 Tax=Pedobacter steynii TaxID=430522 RepID=A0A1G9QZ31_9SPHI|nr:hypothetical protein [Pedobacter steynii]NQX37937.1 hypothetical protein [Pedobacter steynii]SDM16234.1 hypothetical protein SAMN05421820_10361 [Pedobacter steynii]
MENDKQQRLRLLIQSFFKEYSFDEIIDVLYVLYRGWALQVSIKVDRDERLRVLMCYSDLKEFLEEFRDLYHPELPVIKELPEEDPL